MSDKSPQKTQKAYQRKTRRVVFWSIVGAALITAADIVAACLLGFSPGLPAWFISLTAAALVGWMTAATAIGVRCFQRIVEQATATLKKQLHSEVEEIARSLREELHEDLERAARERIAAEWLQALEQPQPEGSNVRRIVRG